MAKRKNSKTAVATVTDASLAAATGKPVDAGDVVSLTDVTEATPTAAVAIDTTTGKEIVAANPALGILTDVPSLWIKASDTFVDFDARTIPNPDQAVSDKAFAISIYLYGQKQPAIGYYDDIDGRVVLTSGRTRRRALVLLNEGFDGIDPRNNEPAHFHDPERKLWVAITPQRNKEEQFVADLETQIVNNPFTPVQEAYAIKKLTEGFGWSLTDAAAKFGYANTNRASKLLKLLTLEQEVIEAVHQGKLSVDAAISTSELKPDVRLSVIHKATDDTSGEVNGGLIKELLRDIYSQGDEAVKAATGRPAGEKAAGDEGDEEEKASSGPKGVSLARNVAKFKAFAESIINDEESDFGEPAKELLRAFTRWFGGVKFGDTALKNAIRTHVKSK